MSGEPLHPVAPAPRRDRKMEAAELAHLLTHKPANPHCEACMRGKLRQVPHRRGAFERPLKQWGDIITMDHMVQRDDEQSNGLNGKRDMITVKDLFSGLVMCYPVPNKSADEALDALNQFCGNFRPRFV